MRVQCLFETGTDTKQKKEQKIQGTLYLLIER